jgi:sterol desaturase/sphingolipid hydroxylase (fatty acid hydroxylase superfamily)
MVMGDWMIDYESTIRLTCFLTLFIVLAIVEVFAPRIQQGNNKAGTVRMLRWSNNFSLIILASVLAKLILPMSLASFALYCQHVSWGLFNQSFFAQASSGLIFIFSLLLFDFIIYWQHRIFHRVPLLWRLHKVHHSDQAFDVSTGIRFHPLEILLSIAIKFCVVLTFGLPASSIIVFEVILNALALFNHSNITIPFDRHIRKLIVTPDMHRVHHSQISTELNSNFGFNLSLWDRIFYSYIDQPSKGHKNIDIGLREFSNIKDPNNLVLLLKIPFNRDIK